MTVLIDDKKMNFYYFLYNKNKRCGVQVFVGGLI